eukprot:scaffold374_cov94-Skeletonema_dohrnii-CCMP3373.AAC.4
MLRKIEPKSFGIAMGKAIIRAGYTKSDVKSGRANRWTLPGDIYCPGGGHGGASDDEEVAEYYADEVVADWWGRE